MWQKIERGSGVGKDPSRLVCPPELSVMCKGALAVKMSVRLQFCQGE